MKPLRILSLGAGVQSSTLLLMAAQGEFEHKPDAAIFADTGWEPRAVYEYLDYLRPLAAKAGIPVHVVSVGNIREDTLAGRLPRASDPNTGETRFASMPFYVRNEEGGYGTLRRQCTKEYKITPLRRKTRELMVLAGAKSVELWMGISLDEVQRMRVSDVKYIANVYPLVDRGVRRMDCLRWMKEHGYRTPPRSACVGCPYHSAAEWREIKADPREWADVVEFDRATRRFKRINGEVFLHRSLQPISEVDLSTAEDNGQTSMFGFNNECDGVCGT
jgi:hypothetical protein